MPGRTVVRWRALLEMQLLLIHCVVNWSERYALRIAVQRSAAFVAQTKHSIQKPVNYTLTLSKHTDQADQAPLSHPTPHTSARTPITCHPHVPDALPCSPCFLSPSRRSP